MSDSTSSHKVAIVTGSSSGVGRATAIALNKAGWSVVLFARRAEQLQETRSLCPNPDKVVCFTGDVASERSVEELFKFAAQSFGRVDLLFNNAGVSNAPVPMESLELSAFQHVVNINLIGSFLCTREAFRYFKSQSPPGGRIINNGSIASQSPRPQAVAYTTTKHAITGLTKSTALDGRAHNITCTQVDIGNAYTPMAHQQTVGVLQADGRIAPEATFDVQHVADSIVHIAELPLDVTVLQYTIMATKMPHIGRG
ncbi:short-chain dehydrogenase/reductase SDR [Cristinia sonorae]|uniref:Short-chain dehydrogenase/reductase SDR n=1 Tax=Cristinia sonorae TaxID=1940300 RepID=A0A8K0UFL6_9AGAR|nr:short-chain dehydrogenase/reductase SDR [Cristinia sonorae]